MSARRPLVLRTALVAAAVVAGAVVVPHEVLGTGATGADLVDQVDGPMKDVIIRPEDLWIDASRTLVDVPSVVGVVDGARERAFVESLAFPRSLHGSAADRQAATDLVTQGLTDAGYTPQALAVTHPTAGVSEPTIWAELPGTQCPDKVLVVGGHYDSVDDGPGADDNASGVAAVLELARALHDNPLPITVRFVGFSFEETGYWGSKAMAAADRAAGTDLVGAVSFDMIAYTSTKADPLSGLPTSDHLVVVSDPDSQSLPNAFTAGAWRYAPDAAFFGLVIDPKVLPDINRSDHASFEKQGYDGMIANDVGVVRNPNYHEPTDTVDTIDWAFLERSTRALVAGTSTFGSIDQDQDGTADLCAGPLRAPATTTTTTTSPSTSTTSTGSSTTTDPPTTSMAATEPVAADGADPVPGSPRYAG